MFEMDDPHVLFGFEATDVGWMTQCRVRNDLGLSFGAASDFSGLKSHVMFKMTFERALSRLVSDMLDLKPSGEPSMEGERVLKLLDPTWYLKDEF